MKTRINHALCSSRNFLIAAASLALGGNSTASSWTWDGGTGAGAAWNTATRWVGDTAPASSTDTDIVFYAAATRLTTGIGTDYTIRSLTFDSNADSNVQVRPRTGSGSGATGLTLTFETDGNDGYANARITVDANAIGTHSLNTGTVTAGLSNAGGIIKLNSSLDIVHNGFDGVNPTILTIGQNNNGTETGSETIVTGNGAINKSGTGTLILAGPNTFNGGLNISGGRVQLQNSSAAGAGTNTITLNGTGAQLQADGVNIANDIVIADTGNDKTIRNYNAYAANFSGTITINETTQDNFRLQSGAGQPFEISGNITGSGGAGVRLYGSGTVTLSGTNDYTGQTNNPGGVLIINGDNSGATGAVNIGATGTLLGTGTVGGATTIASGGIHSAGTALEVVGSQTFSNGIKYESGAIFEWDVAADGSSYDKINGDLLSGNSGAFFNIKNSDFSGAFWNSDHTWDDIFTAGGLATQFSGGFGGDTTAGVVTGQGGFTWNGAYTLKWTAVPEPTSALAGLLLGAGLLRRRRNA